jgi:peroxiredoxin
MHRINSLLVGLCLLMTTSVVSAQKPPSPPKPPKPPTEPTLKLGDVAPELKVDKWLTGKEVKAFEKDTVYVLSFQRINAPEFPQVAAVLSDLHDKMSSKGIKVVGVQSSLRKATGKELERELQYLADALKTYSISYSMAWECEQPLYNTYVAGMASNDKNAMAFVIDKAGKIAYFGTERKAAYVAEKVLDGKWKGQAEADAMTKATEDLQKYMTQLGKKIGQPDKLDDKAMKLLQDELPVMEKMFKDAPYLAFDPQAWQMRLALHLVAKSYDLADVIVSEKIATAVKHKDKGTLGQLAGFFNSGPLKPDPKLAKIVAKITDAYAPFAEPASWPFLIYCSKKYGNNEKADAYMKKALESIPEKDRKMFEEGMKQRLKEMEKNDK